MKKEEEQIEEQQPSSSLQIDKLEEAKVAEKKSEEQIDSSSSIKDLEEYRRKVKELCAEYPNGLTYEPKPDGQILDTDLDFSTLVEVDDSERESCKNFICYICGKVANSPQECSNNDCSLICCSKCINNWKQKNPFCPKKCQGEAEVVFGDLNRYMRDKLHALKFKCEIEECLFTGTYEYAI